MRKNASMGTIFSGAARRWTRLAGAKGRETFVGETAGLRGGRPSCPKRRDTTRKQAVQGPVRRAVSASIAGNVPKSHDLLLRGLAGATASGTLLSTDFSPLTGSLASLGTRAAVFFVGPLSGLYFGHLGQCLIPSILFTSVYAFRCSGSWIGGPVGTVHPRPAPTTNFPAVGLAGGS